VLAKQRRDMVGVGGSDPLVDGQCLAQAGYPGFAVAGTNLAE
jgi:hypothetical protein